MAKAPLQSEKEPMGVEEARVAYQVAASGLQRVPPGYKQTEVGVIPEDWQIVPMGSLGTFGKGQGIRKDEASSGDIPCVRYGELYTHHNDIIRSFNSHISPEVAKTSKRLKKGDLLFAGSGETKDEIGKCAAFVDDEETYAGGDIVILSPNSGSSCFLGYLLNAPIVAVQKASKGQGDAVVHISASALSSIRVPLPPAKAERDAIATALLDMDALLAKLDQLIAKKRNIKQAAMQQLLTGQTRLPGFSGEWEVKRFGDVAMPRKERIDPRKAGVQEFCVELEHIEQGSGRLAGSSSTGAESSLKSVFHTGDVLFGKLRAYLRKYWLANRSGVCSTEIWALVANRGFISPEFLFQLVTVDQFIEAASTAYGTHMPRSDWNVVKNYEVALPMADEQTAIATVLSDMDTEIAALEARRDKTRALKQGMMQELLTGRIRLV